MYWSGECSMRPLISSMMDSVYYLFHHPHSRTLPQSLDLLEMKKCRLYWPQVIWKNNYCFRLTGSTKKTLLTNSFLEKVERKNIVKIPSPSIQFGIWVTVQTSERGIPKHHFSTYWKTLGNVRHSIWSISSLHCLPSLSCPLHEQNVAEKRNATGSSWNSFTL